MRRPVAWALLALALALLVPASPPAASGARGQDSPALQMPPAGQVAPPAPDAAALAVLRRAQARYQSIEDAGGWPTLPADFRAGVPAGAPRARGPLPPAPSPELLQRLCERLAIEGALAATSCEPPLTRTAYDDTLREGVRLFQARHGLEVDGAVGASTVAALNVPASVRARQIALVLARRAAWPDLGDVHVRVNIPSFTLALVDHGREVLVQRVITGAVRTPTPEFSARIEAVEIRPAWNVPDSIYVKEVLPKLRRDAGELAREHYEVVDAAGQVIDPAGIDWRSGWRRYRLRQTPGTHNSLGLLKLDLPNPHGVYLHDTPAKALFARTTRALSHGCIRLQDPLGLAAALLAGDPAWPRDAIAAAMQGAVSRRVRLPAPVPVHVVYVTVTVEGGEVRFWPDVYGRDALMAESVSEG